jgi:hypothetical protein
MKTKVIIMVFSMFLSYPLLACDFSGCGCTGCYRALDMSDWMGYQPVEKKPVNRVSEEAL